MAESGGSNFNNIIQQLIEKSLFTERQIEIILKRRDMLDAGFPITRGAYYRQVCQSREKLVSFFYTVVVLRGLGILLPDDIDVMTKISEQVGVINESDVFPEREEDVINVIDRAVRQACGL